MYSLQYRPQMDQNKYEEKWKAVASPPPPIFWTLGMAYLWPVLYAIHGLCTAYVWPIYGLCMTYIWLILGLRQALRQALHQALLQALRQAFIKPSIKPCVKPYARHIHLSLLNCVISKFEMLQNVYFLEV